MYRHFLILEETAICVCTLPYLLDNIGIYDKILVGDKPMHIDFDWSVFFYFFTVLGTVSSMAYMVWYLHPETVVERQRAKRRPSRREDRALFPGI